MSWKDALQYVKGVAEKKGVTSGDTQQDLQLPLGARIGGIIQLQQTPFIRALTNGSIISAPDTSQLIIKAISRVNLTLAGSLYRYYIATGDNGNKEIFLQVYVNAEGEVSELIYCTQLTRLVPEAEEDQQVYMGLSGYGLGDKTYCLWREQLAELNYSEADLHAAFGAEEAIEYWRDAGDPEHEFIQPFTGSETRLDDAQGMQGVKQDIYYMPYKREINGGEKNVGQEAINHEYLFITTEIVQSKNGDSSKREIHVDFMVGIPLEPERVTIL